MAARKTRASKAASPEAPGWVWMLFGLCLGLVVAAAVYVSDRRERDLPVAASPAGIAAPQGRVEPEPAPEVATATAPPHPATRFDFYEILPKFEVVIPEVESEATPDHVATSVGDPGRASRRFSSSSWNVR